MTTSEYFNILLKKHKKENKADRRIFYNFVFDVYGAEIRAVRRHIKHLNGDYLFPRFLARERGEFVNEIDRGTWVISVFQWYGDKGSLCAFLWKECAVRALSDDDAGKPFTKEFKVGHLRGEEWLVGELVKRDI